MTPTVPERPGPAEAAPAPRGAPTTPEGAWHEAPPSNQVKPRPSPGPSEPPPAAHVADPLIGQLIADRYRIQSLIGRGGMGVVYKVEHVHIGKLMAMKLLSGELAADPNVVRRFRREAHAISKLAHNNTVQIFDFGQTKHLAYLVMEYLPGKDLAQVIATESPLDFQRVARIAAQIAASVAEAHARGIIHRDIKPENVMVVQSHGHRDLVKVLDFGIAKLRDQEDGASVTQSGHLVGTPYYMAPEQIRAEPIDHRVDIYALGALMYKAIAGVPPFWAETPVAVLTKHLTDSLVPPTVRSKRQDLPPEADLIVKKAMQKDPDLRYQSMTDLKQDLVRYLASVGELGDPSQSLQLSGDVGADVGRVSLDLATRGDVDDYEARLRRASLLGRGVLVVLLAALVVAAVYAWRHRPPEVVTSEVEPNDTPALANPLLPDRPLTGLIGKRQSPTHSDADVYKVDVPLGETRVMNLSVSAIPNMDLVVDVVRKGEERPMLVADSGRIGEAEHIPNLTLRGGTYYLRVREFWTAGELPTENVSDTYSIMLRFRQPAPGEEREPNDTLEQAAALSGLEPVTGMVSWGGDVDSYCLADGALPAVVELGPLPALDLVLTVIDRDKGTRDVIDQGGPGEGERSALLAPGAGPICVQVSADSGAGRPRSDPAHPYTLKLVPP